MKAIFLDIDGVLNDSISPGVMHWNSTLPVCVNHLNTILDATDAKIFVISSWVDDVFFVGNNEKFKKFLYERGVKENSIVGFRTEGLSKEDGIEQLIRDNSDIDGFIIIDDNASIVENEYLKSRHLKTQSLVGLVQADVQKVIMMLNEE